MSTEQRRIYEAIKLGPRGKVGGLFMPLLQRPEMAEHIQSLGACLRFKGCLAAPLREIVILAVARYWQCKAEWDAHVTIANREGVNRVLITAIDNGEVPENAQLAEQLVLRLYKELIEDQFISESVYNETVDTIGLDGVVELVVIIGYYTLVSMVLNAFEISQAG